jgi:hypothetical protein
VTLALVADTGGLLRALAAHMDGKPNWPDYETALVRASTVVVPSLVLAEVDYFLRNEPRAMRKLVAEIFDPTTRYEYEAVTPSDIVRALQIDGTFHELQLGLVDSVVATIAERCGIYRADAKVLL